jgi:hypothetical protein
MRRSSSIAEGMASWWNPVVRERQALKSELGQMSRAPAWDERRRTVHKPINRAAATAMPRRSDPYPMTTAMALTRSVAA